MNGGAVTQPALSLRWSAAGAWLLAPGADTGVAKVKASCLVTATQLPADSLMLHNEAIVITGVYLRCPH